MGSPEAVPVVSCHRGNGLSQAPFARRHGSLPFRRERSPGRLTPRPDACPRRGQWPGVRLEERLHIYCSRGGSPRGCCKEPPVFKDLLVSGRTRALVEPPPSFPVHRPSVALLVWPGQLGPALLTGHRTRREALGLPFPQGPWLRRPALPSPGPLGDQSRPGNAPGEAQVEAATPEVAASSFWEGRLAQREAGWSSLQFLLDTGSVTASWRLPGSRLGFESARGPGGRGWLLVAS